MWSNCFFYAVGRVLGSGGNLIATKSRHGSPWPHFMWSPDFVTFEEFEPLRRSRVVALLPILYRGRVRRKVQQHE